MYLATCCNRLQRRFVGLDAERARAPEMKAKSCRHATAIHRRMPMVMGGEYIVVSSDSSSVRWTHRYTQDRYGVCAAFARVMPTVVMNRRHRCGCEMCTPLVAMRHTDHSRIFLPVPGLLPCISCGIRAALEICGVIAACYATVIDGDGENGLPVSHRRVHTFPLAWDCLYPALVSILCIPMACLCSSCRVP